MTRREGTAAAVAFAALTLTGFGAGEARAYGTGGWKDCEPVCDALKDGRAKQLALQAEMLGGGGSSAGSSSEGLTKRERERLEERARIRAGAGEKK
jgi:hypothetical protein